MTLSTADRTWLEFGAALITFAIPGTTGLGSREAMFLETVDAVAIEAQPVADIVGSGRCQRPGITQRSGEFDAALPEAAKAGSPDIGADIAP